MCQTVKKQLLINYNLYYIIVHIIIKHNHKKHSNCETQKQQTHFVGLPHSSHHSVLVLPKHHFLSEQSKTNTFFHAYEKTNKSYSYFTVYN